MILPYDIFPIILKSLQHDRSTLFSCVLVSRTISILTTPLLWKNPFMGLINQYQSALLIRTYLACLNEEERKYLSSKGINIRDFRKPIFDYAGFLKEVLYCYDIHDSILCWILLEYRNYTENLLNDIKNMHQFNEHEMQHPLINALYHMFLKRGRIESLGISIDTLKITSPVDQQFFEDVNTSSLSKLIIRLKDNESENNQQSFEFILDLIKKRCRNIRHVRISNFFIFNNQRFPKIQEIINQQKNLQRLDLLTSEQNIVINDILSSLKDHNYNRLTRIEMQDTDLSDDLRLKGLASIHSLESLSLLRCKGLSPYNVLTLSDSTISLKKLRFINNEFPLGLIISTIGRSLKELKTNQLDDESTEFIFNYCSETLTILEVGVNLSVQHIFYDLIKKLKIIHLKVNCNKESEGQILNNLGNYLPNTLKYLGLFTFKSFNVENLENLLLNCNIELESLEIYGTVNRSILVTILHYIKKNRVFKSLIIDNLNVKDWKGPELTLLKDFCNYGGKLIFN